MLAATVLVFVLYTVALKPGTSTGGGGSHAGAYQAAVAKARGVQGLLNGAGARDGGSPTSTIAQTTPTSSSSAPAHHAAAPTPHPSSTATGNHAQRSSSAPVKKANGNGTSSTGATAAAGSTTTGAAKNAAAPGRAATPAAQRYDTVQAALDHHKVLALLFYNPASPDDKAVEAELKSIPTQGGRVVKLAVPLQELASYASLLTTVPVNFSPTLVLIDHQRQAQEIMGFATSFEIDRRVADALNS
jgi:hypothetical protein